MMTGPGRRRREHARRRRRAQRASRRSRAVSGRCAIRAARRQPRVVGQHRARRRRRSRRSPRAGGAHGGRRRPRSAWSARRGAAATMPSSAGAAFSDHERPTLPHEREERPRSAGAAGVGAHADLDVHAVRAQVREAAPGAPAGSDPRPRPRRARCPASTMRVDAGPGAAHVAAGLERAVERARRGPRAPAASSAFTSACGPPAVRGRPVRRRRRRGVDDDGADQRVRARAPAAPLGQEQRPRHEVSVALVAIPRRSLTTTSPRTGASTYAAASNGTRSSMPSPTPTYRIGSFRSCAIATATPPLAVPSSLVRTMPFTPAARHELARLRPGRSARPSRRAPGAPRAGRPALRAPTTRRILSSSAIRFTRVCSRPGRVDEHDRALAAPCGRATASKTTAAGSAPVRARTMSTPARAGPDRRAARPPRRGTCRPRRSARARRPP